MEIIKTKEFNKSFKKLSQEIQGLYTTQEKKFKENWHDPRLHIKKVRTFEFALSLRVTRRYRVFFYLQDTNKAIFFEIDHRKDIYKL